MDLTDSLELAFNQVLVRRLLIEYFSNKGFAENFDDRVYPPYMQDLVESIPQLSGKVEVVPYAKDIDPVSGYTRLGWNLFVLGNQRMYLGETEHSNLQHIAQKLDKNDYIVEPEAEPIVTRQNRSARDIVNWITRTLGKSKNGVININNTDAKEPQLRSMGQTQSGDFFSAPSPLRPEGTSTF